MLLKKIHITEFKSIRDATPFEVGDITCLVGKNEAGKTALLQAIYRLNPIVESEGTFDVIDDYPRQYVEDYQIAVEAADREPAQVVEATFALEEDDLRIVEAEFGPDALTSKEVILYDGYDNKTTVDCQADYAQSLTYVIKQAGIPESLREKLLAKVEHKYLTETLAETEQTEDVQSLATLVASIAECSSMGNHIYNALIDQLTPKFMYFDDYYQMTGCANIEALQEREKAGKLEKSDYPLQGLIHLARLDFKELLNPTRTRHLKNKLEGAGNHLTNKIIKYWSQNKYLKLRFDVRPAQPGDPEGMTTGTNIWGDVEDTKHSVTTEMGARSKGFVWFFSFLAWYNDLRTRKGPLILLLDEPGLSLHGKAQEDLLQYFEAEIKGKHQLIYTTHSPFMVDPDKFDRVRIVQDKSIESDKELPEEEQGTKVLTDVLEASEDSLFPLQGALGYEVYQTLFIGPNNLIVEGASDLLYLQSISGILDKKGRAALDRRWTITPVGGSDKVPTFVALIGAKTKLRVATLIDIQKKDKQSIENLYKRKLLKKKNVLTFGDFTGSDEADIEDMFEADFYVDMVNAEFSTGISKNITISALPSGGSRILPRLEEYFTDNPLSGKQSFNHYRPARYFAENIATLESSVSDATLDRFENAFKILNKLL